MHGSPKSVTWTIFSLNTIVIIVHVIALILLFKVKRNNVAGSQKYLLVVLCLTELTYSLTDNTRIILVQSRDLSILIIGYDIHMFRATAVLTMDILIMIYITVDRFCEIYLNLKYPIYWNSRKTLLLIASSGIICIILFIIVIIHIKKVPVMQFRYVYANMGILLVRYVYPLAYLCFLVIASISYFYIFKKIKAHKNQRKKITGHLYGKVNVKDRKTKNSFKIFVPSLIILTFFLFMTIPNILQLCVSFNLIPSEYIEVAFILIPIGFLADPIIYIFNLLAVKRKIRKVLLGKELKEEMDEFRNNTHSTVSGI